MAKHLKHGKSLAEKENDNQRVKETVESVLKQIEQDGDKAVRALSKKFDNYNPTSFKLTSKQINDLNPRSMIDRGMLYLPSDRRAEGLVMGQNIRENISLPSLDLPKFSSGFIVNRKKEKDIVEKIGERLNFNSQGIENKIEQLSGGTQQKVMLAKSFARDVQLFILDEPTIGVDIGTRVAIYEIIKEFCESGGAVILISSDLSEIVNLSHRIYIISEKNKCIEFDAEDCNENLIQHHFLNSVMEEAKAY